MTVTQARLMSPMDRPGTGRLVSGREGRTLTWISSVSVLTMCVFLLFAERDTQSVLLPAVTIIAVTLFYLTVLTKRQGQLPIFEAATYFVLATAIYTVIPLVQFVMVGMEWSGASDFRLIQWAPTARQFGGFAWRHVTLLAIFVVTYLLVRGKRLWKMHRLERLTPHMVLSIAMLTVVMKAYLIAVDIYMGPAQTLYEGGGVAYTKLPLIVQQVTNIVLMVHLTLKQCLVIVLLTYWRRTHWRIVLLLWIGLELALTVTAMESRTSTVILLLTFLVGYHHVVKPIKASAAFTAGAIFLGSFVTYGLIRDVDVEVIKTDRQMAWGAANEFQILYANAYDVYRRKQDGVLPEVPRQLFFSDLYRLVPSQILPFYKWEPATWYRDEVLELRDTSMGLMFGIVTQALVGFGWPELIARAVLLALFYAAAHRVWRRYSASYWATMAYLFVIAWAYYAFRASSFEILQRFTYYFAPAAIAVNLLTLLVSVPVRARRRERHAS